MNAAPMPAARRAASSLIVEDITRTAERSRDFAGHETVLLGRDDERGLTALVAIHSTKLGAAIGGTRIWPHRKFDDGLSDVLRLSEGMSYKAALAGLPHGGGKGVILANGKTAKTPALFEAYAEMLRVVADRYYTAEDVGLTLADADSLRAMTPNVLGTTRGGSENPSPITAQGVYLGIVASARHRLGVDGLGGMTAAIQGLGAVGAEVAQRLHDDGMKLIVCDVNEEALTNARKNWAAEIVDPDVIFDAKADIFVPCALGGVLNVATIPRIRASVVAGAANNQLQETRDAERLAEAHILYAPDYVINAGGLMNVAAELHPDGYDRRRVLAQLDEIPRQLEEIFMRSDREGRSTESIALAKARERLA